ncbi:zinc finger BED domain-containing protein RICESLEEPER 2-like [Papaver somniferum]|uniref:zinc finger BED domain-containing protein RICESLEEPER 2-like n=1 Tax=Papaver somniferum TaxID=3469 RepID=UPI000E704B17|nr:zinc finger BED domain-containing protein RICESLEEPER 2-like [Papaver somniferum]
MSSVHVQEQDHYNDVISESEGDYVEIVDSVNDSAVVGFAYASVLGGNKHKLRFSVWEFFKLVVVEDSSKKGVCKAFEQGYKYDSQKGGTSTMRRHKFPERRMSLTSDMWTSITTIGYISLTVHFLDQNGELKKFLLNFYPLPPPHTDWGIQLKVSKITLDNATNNEACARIMKSRLVANKILFNEGKYFHVHCCAHILVFIVKEGLEKIDPVVLKIRQPVKSLKKSQVRKQKFLDIVDTLGMSGRRDICQDVKTRWDSIFLML